MMKWSTGEQVGWWQYIGEQELEEGLSCDYWPWVEVEGGAWMELVPVHQASRRILVPSGSKGRMDEEKHLSSEPAYGAPDWYNEGSDDGNVDDESCFAFCKQDFDASEFLVVGGGIRKLM